MVRRWTGGFCLRCVVLGCGVATSGIGRCWVLETWKMLAYVDVEVAFCRVIAIDEQLYFVSQRQMQFCSWQEKNEAGQSKMQSLTTLCVFEAQKNHEKSQPHVPRTETFLRSKGVTTWLYVSGLDTWKTPELFAGSWCWPQRNTNLGDITMKSPRIARTDWIQGNSISLGKDPGKTQTHITLKSRWGAQGLGSNDGRIA